jgi:hypothetical protein
VPALNIGVFKTLGIPRRTQMLVVVAGAFATSSLKRRIMEHPLTLLMPWPHEKEGLTAIEVLRSAEPFVLREAE